MKPESLAALRSIYCPRQTAQRIACKGAECEGFIWTDARGRPSAVLFHGRSARPLGPYWFKTPERREAWVRDQFNAARGRVVAKELRRAEAKAKRAAGHQLTVGAILRASWGYDQTNIDYYQVTALIGSTMVEIRPIAQERTQTGWEQGECVPAPGQFTGEASRHRVGVQGDYVRVDSVRTAFLQKPARIVEGIPVYSASSWSAYH